jgi:cytochrome b561
LAEDKKYHIVARIIHWAMSLIIISLLCIGFYMVYLLDKDSVNRADIYSLHKSFGVAVLILFFVRVFVRITKKAPTLPDSISRNIQKLAHFVHYSLYFLMISMPLSGYLMSNSYGYPVKIFGASLPFLIGKNIELGKIFALMHMYLGFAFVAFLFLHIAGVIKHRFFDKKENDILPRMI